LHDAIAIGEIPVIKMLVSLGANPNALNSRGEPPIACSFDKGATSMEQIISVIKPDLSIKIWKPQYNLLQWAVFSNRAEAAAVLMKHGLNPHEKNADGQDCFDLLVNIKHPVDQEQMRKVLGG
jgi:ankyrin repeat protein